MSSVDTRMEAEEGPLPRDGLNQVMVFGSKGLIVVGHEVQTVLWSRRSAVLHLEVLEKSKYPRFQTHLKSDPRNSIRTGNTPPGCVSIEKCLWNSAQR